MAFAFRHRSNETPVYLRGSVVAIDLPLELIALISGRVVAESAQLNIQFAADSPVHAGDPEQSRVTISHAIYMEPVLGSPGDFQPFWGLSPRFCYQFDLDWPVAVTGWFNYNISRRTDGQCGGDAEFPTGEADQCVVGGLLDPASLFSSYVPGELLVGFRDNVDESTARKVVARELPGSQVLDAVWSIRILRITCIPFDEIKQGKRMEDADEVRYAAVNSHVSLIVPGGFWKTTQLKAVV